MPNEMQDAVQATGCKLVRAFSQVQLLQKYPAVSTAVDNPSGICWGLAFVWMEYKSKKSHERFFVDLDNLGEKATLLKAAGLYRIVQAQPNKLSVAAASCGLQASLDDSGDAKSKYSLSVSESSDMQALAQWLGSAMGNRFFLIESDGHAMAASGSKTGSLEFFDPNFGVVGCWSSNTMASFFSDFFKRPRISQNYWKRPPRTLTVHRFKKI